MRQCPLEPTVVGTASSSLHLEMEPQNHLPPELASQWGEQTPYSRLVHRRKGMEHAAVGVSGSVFCRDEGPCFRETLEQRPGGRGEPLVGSSVCPGQGGPQRAGGHQQ